jgi:hypothetical protein
MDGQNQSVLSGMAVKNTHGVESPFNRISFVRFDLASMDKGPFENASLGMRLLWAERLPADIDIWLLPADHPDAQGDIVFSRWYGPAAPWKPDGHFDGSGLIHLGKLAFSPNLADGAPMEFTSSQLNDALRQRIGQTITLVLSTQHTSTNPVGFADPVLMLKATQTQP